MAWALSYLGTLALVGFLFHASRQRSRDSLDKRLTLCRQSIDTLAQRMDQAESALASPQQANPVGYDELRETVTTLAAASGLTRRGGKPARG